ncbi:hypothetical protein AB0E82_33965 [Streptomyces anulatus]|uniref:hypothetical protein n=1 Tax=Streptomyces anulatus TaxID=1892 RepID=UPI0033C51A2D
MAEKLIFPDGRPKEPWSPETERRAVAGLIGLTDEYLDNLASNPEERPETVLPPGEPGISIETTPSPTVASDATSWH